MQKARQIDGLFRCGLAHAICVVRAVDQAG
jgi:nicotinamidase-related amidase